MPTYPLLNTETGEEFEIQMKISEYVDYMKDNPHLKRRWPSNSAPKLGYNDARKPDDSFRDILRDIKKGSGKGANINTF